MIKEGQKLEQFEFPYPVPEGSINLYYGKIRSGKTYGATADIVEEVKRGRVIYATWPIALECFDDRFSFFMTLKNLLFFQKIHYRIDCPKNFHYINATTGEVDGKREFDPEKPTEYIKYLNKLNHCSLYIDEAWRVIDSYKGTNMSMDSRNLILVTGHQFRTVNLIAQRPTSIHVSARGNVNRFYKFEKVMSWPFIRFQRSEYQEMAGETVDETKEPDSVKYYWAKKAIFNAYNSYFYGDLKPIHSLNFEAFSLSFYARINNIVFIFLNRLKAIKKIFYKKSMGDKSEVTTIKNRERLNTIPVSVNSFEESEQKRRSLQEALPF